MTVEPNPISGCVLTKANVRGRREHTHLRPLLLRLAAVDGIAQPSAQVGSGDGCSTKTQAISALVIVYDDDNGEMNGNAAGRPRAGRQPLAAPGAHSPKPLEPLVASSFAALTRSSSSCPGPEFAGKRSPRPQKSAIETQFNAGNRKAAPTSQAARTVAFEEVKLAIGEKTACMATGEAVTNAHPIRILREGSRIEQKIR